MADGRANAGGGAKRRGGRMSDDGVWEFVPAGGPPGNVLPALARLLLARADRRRAERLALPVPPRDDETQGAGPAGANTPTPA